MDLMSKLAGCLTNGLDVPDKVEKKLSEKYGQKFILTNIGNRFNTGTATLFCHPLENKNLNFTVVYDFETGEIKDDFKVRKIAEEFDCFFSEAFRKEEIECGTFTMFIGCPDQKTISTSEKADDYMKRPEVKELFCHIAVRGDDVKSEQDSEKLLKVLTDTSKKIGRKIVSSFFFISGDSFEECRESLESRTRVNQFWFENYNCIYSCNVIADNDSLSVSAAEINKGLRG